jgi:hypothetical protein
MTRSYSLLTKTFKNDLAEFTTLCASIDQHMPGIRHYVLVDRTDLPLFRPFATDRRIIIDSDALLPGFHEFEVLGRRLWWRPPFNIVRGWIYQQLAKIAFVSRCEEDAIVLVDSDAQFIRAVEERHVFSASRVVLFRNPGKPSGGAGESDNWHNVALRVFGLPETGYTGADYISQAVVWSPVVVKAMIERIEATTSMKWHDALIVPFRFSEYVLYGVFSEHVQGPHQALLAANDQEICHCSWHYDLASARGIDDFVAGLGDHHVAILLQSNLQINAHDRDRIMARFIPEEA